MGKNLHYSILPFVKKALAEHTNVSKIEMINDSDFYIIKVYRNFGSDLHVVLSDDYYFGDYAQIEAHSILKDGGFILIARPEATNSEGNDVKSRIGVGKIGRLLGALNKPDYWTHEPAPKKST
jgi:hypothetical protein